MKCVCALLDYLRKKVLRHQTDLLPERGEDKWGWAVVRRDATVLGISVASIVVCPTYKRFWIACSSGI
eukprot:3329641-Amphidinium_carterae.2